MCFRVFECLTALHHGVDHIKNGIFQHHKASSIRFTKPTIRHLCHILLFLYPYITPFPLHFFVHTPQMFGEVIRILAIDDEQDILRLIKKALRGQYQVDTVLSAPVQNVADDLSEYNRPWPRCLRSQICYIHYFYIVFPEKFRKHPLPRNCPSGKRTIINRIHTAGRTPGLQNYKFRLLLPHDF